MEEKQNGSGRPRGKQSAGAVISAIKRRTRKIYSAEEKIQIVIEGLRGEESVAAVCESMAFTKTTTITVDCRKEFMEAAGKKRLS